MTTIPPALPHLRTPSWRGVALAAGLGLSLAAPAEPRETWSGPALASLPRAPLAAQRPAPWPGFEVEFRLPDTGRHPDDVRVEARFTSPGCEPVRVGGFADGDRFKVRFAPPKAGTWRYEVTADGVPAASGQYVAEKASPGRLQVRDGRLVHADGSPFFMLGENRINIYDPSWNHEGKSIEDYVAAMAESGMNTLRVFIPADREQEEPTPGPQPACLEPGVGRFDPEAARIFDRIMAAAERQGLHVVLTAYAVGFTPNETWKSWEDNPYSREAGGPLEENWEFFDRQDMRPHAKRKLDYILDRWGASPALLAVDLLNEPEWDGNLGEDVWIPWAEEMADHWHSRDPYGSLVTVGSVGLHWNVEGDERRWYGDPRQDLVQWHRYGPDTYDVHDLANVMTAKVDETLGYGKPVFCGEFAWGGEAKPEYDHTHVGIWSLTFAGGGALAHSAPPFTEDSDEPMTPERAKHFRVLADFLAGTDWADGVRSMAGSVSVPGARAWALGGARHRALWVMADKASYGSEVRDAAVTVKDLPAGRYRLEWVDDVTGASLGTSEVEAEADGVLTAPVPPFRKHVAARLTPA